jgi:hypothetical protein
MKSELKQPAVKFFIADDIRLDSPKPMIIGLLVDDVVGIALPAEHAGPSVDSQIALASLAILASFIGTGRVATSEVSLYAPDKKAIFENQKIEIGSKNSSSSQETSNTNNNILIKLAPFGISAFGEYKLIVKLNGTSYSYIFHIKRVLKSSF